MCHSEFQLKMQSLTDGTSFIHNLLNGLIDPLNLLSKISLVVLSFNLRNFLVGVRLERVERMFRRSANQHLIFTVEISVVDLEQLFCKAYEIINRIIFIVDY